MARPMISVVVPARVSGRSPIAECVAALVSDPYATKEVLVIDNGSTVEAMDEARRLGVRVVHNTHLDAGCAGPRNMGAELAIGDVLFFVDSDVIISPGAFDRLDEVLRDESVGAVFGVESPDPGFANFSSVYRNLWVRFSLLRLPRRPGLLHSSCMAIRAELFRRVGGFDERYRECSIEDAELGRCIVAAGGAIVRDEELTFQHRRRFDLVSLLSAERSRAAAITAWQLRSMRQHLPHASRAFTVPPAHRHGFVIFTGSALLLSVGLAAREGALCLIGIAGIIVAVSLRADFLLFLACSRSPAFVARSALFLVADYLWVLFGTLQGIYRVLAGRW